MTPTVFGMIVFAFSFGGALLGMWLRTALPEHHLAAESKDTVKIGIGLIATMTALVLGLVTASLLVTGLRPATFVRACSNCLGRGST